MKIKCDSCFRMFDPENEFHDEATLYDVIEFLSTRDVTFCPECLYKMEKELKAVIHNYTN